MHKCVTQNLGISEPTEIEKLFEKSSCFLDF